MGGEIVALETAILAYTKAQVSQRTYAIKAPNGVAMPYIVFSVVSNNFIHVMGGDSGLSETRVQFSVFGDRYDQVKGDVEKLKKTYRNYIEGGGALMGGTEWVQSTLLGNETDIYEDATDLFHTALDITFWHMEGD